MAVCPQLISEEDHMWQAGVNPIGCIAGFSGKWKNGKDISPHAHFVHNDLRIQQLFCTLGCE